MARRVVLAGLVFAVAYALNFVWEYAHYPLYVCDWNRLVCALVASIGDGVIVLGIYWLIAWVFSDLLWISSISAKQATLAVLSGLAVAWIVELRALALGKWLYSASMPIVPGTGAGLSPLLQLALLPLLTFWVAGSIARSFEGR